MRCGWQKAGNFHSGAMIAPECFFDSPGISVVSPRILGSERAYARLDPKMRTSSQQFQETLFLLRNKLTVPRVRRTEITVRFSKGEAP
jgi:hypothetical protein